MPIQSTDLPFKLSTKSGSSGNSTAGTAAGSLGKYISTTTLADATLDNLFDDVTGDENAAEDVEYRCLFIRNAHASLALQRATVWISSEVSGGAVTAIALDNIGVTLLGSTTPQAAQIADENTAPAGVTAFSAPTTKAAGLLIGDIPAGSVAAIWIRRTATNSPAVNNDGVVVRVEGDTAA